MQRKIVFSAIVMGFILLFAFRNAHRASVNAPSYITRQEAYKNKPLVSCSPNWSLLNIDSLANDISILKGWGNYPWNISSKSDSARLYFQQGVNMYYAFHIIESMASFKKAQKFDDTNAMIYWAQALAYGPNINDFEYLYTPDAFSVAQKALALSAQSTEKEKALIKAMSVRYTADSTVSRASLNQLYTDEMKKAYLQFPTDADVSTLYADAMMLQHPWEYWKHNGEAHPWTPPIVAVLEKTIARIPLHPGANHYYIHMVEASANPQRALSSAHRLSKLMPSVSHMVHMPSHIYIRSGLYAEGIKVNEMSLSGYHDYLSVFPGVEANAPLYLIHNLHMQTACAMMGSDYAYSAKSAVDCQSSFDTSFMSIPPPLGNYIQYVYATPFFNDIRFGKWDEILASPEVPREYIFADLLSHWSKGIAYARKNSLDKARQELQYVRDHMYQPNMLVVMEPFNSPLRAAGVAEKMLEGIIAEQEKDYTKAALLLSEAVKKEADMIYTEPKDWLLPVRPYLGAVLMKAGQYARAEKVFKDDLKDNPNNHWALKGLAESLQKQKKHADAALIQKQLQKSLARAGMKELPVVF